MATEIPVRKLVIELRYKPDLGFYGKMDGVALELSDQFPDWERSPLTVEIRNKKKHRRVFLAHKRCFYECDLLTQSPISEFEYAVERLERVNRELQIAEFTRIGVRQWIAADLGKTFALMVDELKSRFYSPSKELSAILTDEVSDLAYGIDCESNEGWKYHLRLGPMTRQEWFQRIPYERGNFETSDEAEAASFEEYRKTIPENLLLVDVDCYRQTTSVTEQGTAASQMKSQIAAFRRRSHDLIGQLIDYCQG